MHIWDRPISPECSQKWDRALTITLIMFFGGSKNTQKSYKKNRFYKKKMFFDKKTKQSCVLLKI